MSLRQAPRLRALLGLAASAFLLAGGCYRAEIDLSLLRDDTAPMSAGTAGSGGVGADCDDSPLDALQLSCQFRYATTEECSAQDGSGWDGCAKGDCKVCAESVRDYAHYFDWHPCCQVSSTCNASTLVECNPLCPEPSERDRRLPCFLVD